MFLKIIVNIILKITHLGLWIKWSDAEKDY